MVNDAGQTSNILGNGDAFVLSLVCQHRAGNDIANRPDT